MTGGFGHRLVVQVQGERAAEEEDGESPLGLLCSAACAVLQSQPSLRERLPVLGHLPQLCSALARQPSRPGCLRLLHQASTSQVGGPRRLPFAQAVVSSPTHFQTSFFYPMHSTLLSLFYFFAMAICNFWIALHLMSSAVFFSQAAVVPLKSISNAPRTS